jgi:uncharacterized protein (TIGR03437 family)
VNTIAGHGKLAYAGDGKAATSVNLFSPNRVAFDAAGNLYFTESYYNRVFKLGAAGTLTAIAGNGGETFAGEGGAATAAAIPDPEGIAVDAAGNVYVGTSARICKISGGQLHTIAGTGDDGYSGDRGQAISAQIHTPEGIAIDGAGNIFFSQSENSVVRRIGTDGTITTVAGTGTPGYNGDGSPATSFQLSTPEALVFDAGGNLYIADSLNNRVRKLAPNGAISTFAGTGVAGDGGSGFAIGAKLFQPSGVAVDSAGNVYIADTANSLLKMVDLSGAISTFSHSITSLGDVAASPAGWLAAPDFLQQVINRIVWTSTATTVTLAAGVVRTAALGDRGLATNAYFVDPWSLAADPTGNWYVADEGDQRVRKIGVDQSITTAAGTGIFGWSDDSQPATASEIAQPRALAADSAGNIYFTSACQIREFLPNGTVKTVADSNGNCGYSVDPSPALDAQLQFPWGLAIDSSGMLYISDTFNNRIRRLNLTTSIITTIAGNGQVGYAGNGTAALQAKMDTPLGLAADSKGNVYFADQNNHRVRKITAAGIISDFAGTGVCNNPADGPATSSPLCYPSGVAVDAAGNVYIADSAYIRRVTPDGALTTIAGNGWYDISGEGQPALSTAIDPFYVALDTKGRVCFSDSTNLRIRCLDAASTTPPTPPAATVTVVNAATFLTGPVAPGEIVTIYGAGMGPASLVAASLDASGPPLATTLAGVQIAFDGVAAPLLYVSATQSSAIVPFAVAGKTSTAIQVTYQNKSAGSATLSVAAASPGLFTMASSGSGQGAILNQDWSVNSAALPAAHGDILMLFGTGGGITSPPSADGQFSTGTPANLAAPPTVTIGGVSGTVWYAGAAPGMVAGVFQINVQVPGAAPSGGSVPIVVQSGTASSPATVTVALK